MAVGYSGTQNCKQKKAEIDYWNSITGANLFSKISVKVQHFIGSGSNVVLSTNAKNPGILFACKASREVALSNLSECLDLGAKQTRFDPTNDTICLYQYEAGCRHIVLLPGKLYPHSTYGKYIHKFARAQRFIMEWYPGIPGQVERILSQLPKLKTLVVVSNSSCKLCALDMDSGLSPPSLRVGCYCNWDIYLERIVSVSNWI